MAFIDYYKIMGISKDTPQKDIKAAYKKRAKQFHPDLHPDDPKAKAKFQALNEAYDVLNDPEKRAKYDQYGEHWKMAGMAALKDLISASLQEEASRTSSRKCSAEAADAHAATAAASNGDSTRLETKAGL